MRKLIITALLLVLIPTELMADDRDAIVRIIDDIRIGWEQADGEPFRKHFLDFGGARYVESGGQNIGLTDLIEHHVEPEGDALKLELEFTNPQIQLEGDFAWVIFETEVQGTFYETGKKIHNRGFETIVLRKINDQWKVLHTHSSGRPVDSQ